MSAGNITVVSGANDGNFPFAGYTVGEVRDRLEDLYNIDEAARATVGNTTVNDGYVLAAGDKLVFTKTAGEKG